MRGPQGSVEHATLVSLKDAQQFSSRHLTPRGRRIWYVFSYMHAYGMHAYGMQILWEFRKLYPEALRADPPPRYVGPDVRILRSRRGPWGASGVPWGSPGAQGRSGVSERGSRGSRGCLGCVPGIIQIISFGRWIAYRNKCFVVLQIFDEMKGRSGFHTFSNVFINVPSVEQGGEFIGKTNRNWRFASWTLITN